MQKLEVFVGGKTLKFETGKIGRTADGSVTLTVGECVLYSSAVAGKDPMVGFHHSFVALLVPRRRV